MFVLAAIGLSLYMLNIAAGMAAVKLGWKLTRLNDVWEFLIVLVSMVLFCRCDRETDEPQSH